MNRNLIIKPSQVQGGATLVELLVALLITGLVFAGVYQIYINTVRSTSVQDQVVDMQQTARVVMDQLMREFRMAGYEPDIPTGIAPILNFNSNPMDLSAGKTLLLVGDFISDNATVPDQVTYKIDSTTDPKHPSLTRQLNGGAVVNFGANVQNLVATFYDSSNCQLGTALCPLLDVAKIKRADVQLTVRTNTEDNNFKDPVYKDGYRRRTLTGEVVLRNTEGQAKDTTPPPCPINVTAAITGGCRVIRVTWTRPPDPGNDIAGYFIYYSQSAISTSTSSFVNITNDPNKTNYQYDLSVPTTGSWNIAVTSYDSAGNLCDSNAGNGYPPADPVVAAGSAVNVGAPTKIPSPPPNPLGVPTDNQVSVTWGQVLTYTDGTTAAGLAGFRLYRSQAANMSGAVTIANEFSLPISQILGGGVNQTTQYDDNAANTIVAGVPSPPLNCSTYYYQVSVVDQCNLESARSTVQSAKPNGSVSPGVTPPDNGKAPPSPTITSLEAGDDTAIAILTWAVDAPSASQSTPIGIKIYWREKGTLSWNPDPAYPPLDIPISSGLPATGKQVIPNLATNTWYDFYVSAYDDPATSCGDESASGISQVFTGACAPSLAPAKNANYSIFPGITTIGSPLPNDNSAEIGLLSSSKEEFLTWTAAPTDCTPDSSFFAAQGYDYTNPPAYDKVAFNAGTGISAHVEFYMNNVINGVPSADIKADTQYGKTATGTNTGNTLFPSNSSNIDYAPRGADKYYHFPTDPINSFDFDTAKFCDAQYDFKVIAVDGEQYVATATTRIEIKNGGIEVDSSKTVTSDIDTLDDFHHIVRFGIHNTNAAKDLKLNKITLLWDNNNAFLEKLEVLAADKSTVLGLWNSSGGTPAGRVGFGTQLTLNPIPTLKKAGTAGNADQGYIRLTFKDSTGSVTSSADMRALGTVANETITILSLDEQDAAASGTSGTCSAVTTAGSVVVQKNPAISAADTVQNQPAADTALSQLRGTVIVPAGKTVTVSTKTTPNQPASMKIYYNVDSQNLATAPARPASAGGGGNYTGSVAGTYDGTNLLWNIGMPSSPNTQIWFYLEAMDGTVLTDPFNRNFDIYPDSGVFTYVQCGATAPTVTITKPSANTSSGTQTVNATVSTAILMKSVTLTVTDDPSSGGVPDFTGDKPMCFGTDACSGATASGTSQGWTTTYGADCTNAAVCSPSKTNVKHTITVTAINACGLIGSAAKNLN